MDVKIQDPALADAKELRSNWDHMCSVRVVRVIDIVVLKLERATEVERLWCKAWQCKSFV